METKSYELTLGINISAILELFIFARRMIGPDVRYGLYTIDKILENLKIEINNDFKLIVDYGLSLEEMTRRRHYSNEKNIFSDESYLKVIGKYNTTKDTPIKKEEIVRLFFMREIDSMEIIPKIKNVGFQPATIRELLAFGEQYPEIQELFCIPALGSIVEDDDGENEHTLFLSNDKKICSFKQTKNYIFNGIICSRPLHQEFCFLGIKQE